MWNIGVSLKKTLVTNGQVEQLQFHLRAVQVHFIKLLLAAKSLTESHCLTAHLASASPIHFLLSYFTSNFYTLVFCGPLTRLVIIISKPHMFVK